MSSFVWGVLFFGRGVGHERNTQVSEGGAGEGILEQPVMRQQAETLHPLEIHSGAKSHLWHVEDPTPDQVATPKAVCIRGDHH